MIFEAVQASKNAVDEQRGIVTGGKTASNSGIETKRKVKQILT